MIAYPCLARAPGATPFSQKSRRAPRMRLVSKKVIIISGLQIALTAVLLVALVRLLDLTKLRQLLQITNPVWLMTRFLSWSSSKFLRPNGGGSLDARFRFLHIHFGFTCSGRAWAWFAAWYCRPWSARTLRALITEPTCANRYSGSYCRDRSCSRIAFSREHGGHRSCHSATLFYRPPFVARANRNRNIRRDYLSRSDTMVAKHQKHQQTDLGGPAAWL